MPKPRPIEDIIAEVQSLHEATSETEQEPYIVDVPLRGPHFYSLGSVEASGPRWDTHRIDRASAPGQDFPRLLPAAESRFGDDGQVVGLTSWPPRDYGVESRVEQEDGIDALAWYRSFHYAPVGKWGIYMLDRGVYILAEEFAKQYGSRPLTPEVRLRCIQDAVESLYFHELFHFYVDLAAARLEILEKQPRYVDYFRNRYKDGWTTKHGEKIPHKLEEALANEFARSVTARGRSTAYKDVLDSFMRRQPDGYKQWKAVGHHNKWSHGMSKLGERLLNPPSPYPSYLHVTALEEAVDAFYRGQVPVYLVNTFEPLDDFELMPKMVVFDKVDVKSSVEEQVNSNKTPHDVRKQFNKFIQQLKDIGHIRAHRRLNKANKPGHYFWDVSKGWRALLVQASPNHYTVTWLGDHNAYERYRKKESL
jgi:hypothetical protein